MFGDLPNVKNENTNGLQGVMIVFQFSYVTNLQSEKNNFSGLVGALFRISYCIMASIYRQCL